MTASYTLRAQDVHRNVDIVLELHHGLKMSYSFPKLKYQEIVSCLREQGIPLSLQDLQDPSEEKMRPVYEKLVENVMGLPKVRTKVPSQHLHLCWGPADDHACVTALNLSSLSVCMHTELGC